MNWTELNWTDICKALVWEKCSSVYSCPPLKLCVEYLGISDMIVHDPLLQMCGLHERVYLCGLTAWSMGYIMWKSDGNFLLSIRFYVYLLLN